jgi:quercetin dioxygenase-like cupin family protein
MFYHHRSDGYKDALPGIKIKTLTYGEKTLLTEFKMETGSQLVSHSHPHEQIGYLVSGHIRLTIGSETFDVKPGDSWNVPGNLEHCAEIIADSVAIEVFSPVREDYLPETLNR